MHETDKLQLGLGTLLRRLLASLDGDVQKVYDSLGVPFKPRFFPVVQHLRAHGATNVGVLAKQVGVSQPAITQTVAEMREAGLVSTVTCEDRRARIVRLTEEGEALSDRLQPVWLSIHRAGVALDAELPASLRLILSTALDRLENRPFHDRIRQQWED